MSHPQVLEVVCGLVWRNGQLLITRRRAKSHLGGLWEFPGGKRQPAESDAQALRRELKEETGLEVEVGERYYETHYTYPDRNVQLRFYTCQARTDAEAQTLEVAEAQWINPSELANYNFPPANTELLTRLLQGKPRPE